MSGRLRILLVEDDKFACTFIRKALNSPLTQTDVEVAATVASGIDKLQAGKVDCVLLDFGLPDGNAFAFLNKARELDCLEAPVVILTARNDEETAIEAMRQGAEDYLIKGRFDSDVLARAIRYAIERHRVKKELDDAKDRLEQLSVLDPLTELLNRRGFQQALSREFRLAQRSGADLVVVLVDLDDFKMVNDSFGHAAGDVVLKEVATRLTAAVRPTDFVCRIGGDEFMILLPDTNLGEGVQLAERIRMAVSSTPVSFSSGAVVRTTASLGVVSGSETVPSIDAMLAKTHSFLRNSKTQGKDRVTSAGSDGQDPEEQQEVSDIISPVLKALRDGKSFLVVGQPIVHLPDGKIIAYELLSRLSVPVFENPGDFFGVATQARIITSVDHQCFNKCIEAASVLPRHVRRHVNLFPSTIIGAPVDHLIHAIQTLDSGAQYCIELSEQQIIGDPSYLLESVLLLKQAGIIVALDDLGFGRSCLESLVVLEPDLVKIDKKLVTRVSQDPGRLRSLTRLVQILSTLAVEMVAEGVEEPQDAEVLVSLGVTSAQGYHFGRPAPLPGQTTPTVRPAQAGSTSTVSRRIKTT